MDRHFCLSCNRGYYKVESTGNSACLKNQCKCDDGAAHMGEECPSHNGFSCSTCNPGFYLDEGACHKAECTCDNGMPVSNVNCTEHQLEYCQSCNENFNLYQNKCEFCDDGYYFVNETRDNSVELTCQGKVCECKNGIHSLRENCTENGDKKCDSCVNNFNFMFNSQTQSMQCDNCKQNYKLTEKDDVCIKHECFCENGEPIGWDSCREDGAFICAANGCDQGFEYNAYDFTCKSAFKCQCYMGVEAEGVDCVDHGEQICESCYNGYHLVRNEDRENSGVEPDEPIVHPFCEKDECSCDFGQTPSPCRFHFDESCVSCDEGYVLIADKCVLSTCKSTEFEVLNLETGEIDCFSADKTISYNQGAIIEERFKESTDPQFSVSEGVADSECSNDACLNLESKLKVQLQQIFSRMKDFKLLDTGRHYKNSIWNKMQTRVNFEITFLFSENDKTPIDYFNEVLSRKETITLFSQNGMEPSCLNGSFWPWSVEEMDKNVVSAEKTNESCEFSIGLESNNVTTVGVDDSGCKITVSDGVESNSCELSEEDLSESLNELDAILDIAENEVIGEAVAVNVVNKLENIFRVDKGDDDEAGLATASVVAIQAKFEDFLKKMGPGLEFESRDGTVKIKTSDTPETSFINPITGETVSTPAYTFSSEKLSVVLPASLLPNPNARSTGANTCLTPVSFAQINNARHLKPPGTMAFGKKVWSRTGTTSIAITTCNDDDMVFDEPILLAFTQKKETNDTEFSAADVECGYYNEKLLTWVTSPAIVENGIILCETYHLTYFTLLFRNRGVDNKALDITDKVLTIISLIVLMFLVWFNFSVKGSKKLKLKPILRSQLNLAVSLILMNLVYLFGQQWLSPPNGDSGRNACAAIAAVTQFTICAFFMITVC